MMLWEVLDPATGEFESYGTANSDLLETAYQGRKAKQTAPQHIPLNGFGGQRHVDVELLIESVVGSPLRKTVVRRSSAVPPPRLTAVADLVICENERYMPIVGWGKKRLPTDRPQWSDVTGKHNITLPSADALIDSLHLPSWVPSSSAILGSTADSKDHRGHWSLYREAGHTDTDGWQYSVDFPHMPYHDHMATTDFVRRRCWTRSVIVNPCVAVVKEMDKQQVPDEIRPMFSRIRFVVDPKELSQLEARAASFTLATLGLELQLCEALEADRRAEIIERCNIDSEHLVALDAADVARLKLERVRQQTDVALKRAAVLDEWAAYKGPRQAAVELTVLNISSLTVPLHLSLSHKLRIRVQYLSNNVTELSEEFDMRSDFRADFKTFIVASDDTKPVLIAVEAVGHSLVDLVTEPLGVVLAPLNLRSQNPRRVVSDDTLVYHEFAQTTLQCLDGTGKRTTSALMAVAWSLEPRKSDDVVVFCDGCGFKMSRCKCSPEEAEELRLKRGREEANRLAEIYAARNERLAKAEAEAEAKRKREAELQQQQFSAAQLETMDACFAGRRKMELAENSEITSLNSQFAEKLNELRATKQRRDRAKSTVKQQLQQLLEKRHLAAALAAFSSWSTFAHARSAARRQAADVEMQKQQKKMVVASEASEREDIEKLEASALKIISSQKQEDWRDVVASSGYVESAAVAVTEAQVIKHEAQQQRKHQQAAAGSKCCAIM